MKKTLIALSFIGSLSMPFYAVSDNGAGCGLGQQIFAGKSGLGPHILAATTNGTSSNQLFGLSFDSLGCDGESTITASYQRKMYIHENMDSIARDAAKGSGDHLHALADLLAITTEDQPAFFKMTQVHYTDLFTSPSFDAQSFMQRLNSAMQNEPQLNKYSIQ